MGQHELVFSGTQLLTVPRTQQPAAVQSTVKPLTGTIDGIDHQQVTTLGVMLPTAQLKHLLIGSSQSGETQQSLTFDTAPDQALEQIRDQLPALLK